jgi:signal transduction histidine kinase
MWRRHGWWVAGVAAGLAVAPARAATPVLRTAAEVRALGELELAARPPVHLRGVVTFHEPATGLTFVQDGPAGVAIAAGVPSRLAAEVRSGLRVEVQGSAAPGRYTPAIEGEAGAPPRVSVSGMAPLPEALPAGIEELLGGANDGRWIELRGIIRSVAAKRFVPAGEGGDPPAVGPDGAEAPLRLSMELGTTAGRFTLIVPWTPGREPPRHLLDARVRARGVAGPIVNSRRQWVGLLLYVPSLDEIRVERPPAADPFGLPLRRVDEIKRFTAEAPDEPRVRVRGVVTGVQAGFRVFLRGDGGPLEVQTPAALDDIEPGAEVEAVGYPTLGPARVVLQDGRLRRLAQGTPPAPREMNRSEVLARYADAELVRLTGRLFENSLRGEVRVLVLEVEGRLLEARFLRRLTPEEERRLGQLRPRTELAVSGIAQVAGAADWGGGVRPFALNLLLRGPADLTVLHEPPWWTPARLAGAIGALLLVVAFGAGWVVLLRRRVAAQTAVIREQARREANERERRRIAQDIHDDLGSRLTQLALLGARVRAAAVPDTAAADLGARISETARTTVQTMDEIVWAVNPGNDTLQSLGDYLCKVATSLLGGAGIACRLAVPEVLPERPVSAELRHNLVLAVREALNNVIKHSRAAEASLTLRLDGDVLTIEVGDNGVGLPTAGAARGNGLGNLRRRLAESHGTCEIGANDGGGTRVRFAVTLGAP